MGGCLNLEGGTLLPYILSTDYNSSMIQAKALLARLQAAAPLQHPLQVGLLTKES